MRHLGIAREPADELRRDYWRRYGATLLGLVRHHAVDARDFLRDTHDFDILALLRSHPGAVGLLRRLPGRKVLLTNAPAAYARTVTVGLGIHRHLARHYAIESMRIHGSLRPKPARGMLRAMLARERVGPPWAVLVDDNLAQLESRADGRTAHCLGHGRASGRPQAALRGSPGAQRARTATCARSGRCAAIVADREPVSLRRPSGVLRNAVPPRFHSPLLWRPVVTARLHATLRPERPVPVAAGVPVVRVGRHGPR